MYFLYQKERILKINKNFLKKLCFTGTTFLSKEIKLEKGLNFRNLLMM